METFKCSLILGGVTGFHDLTAFILTAGRANVVGAFQLSTFRAFFIRSALKRVMGATHIAT